VDALFPENLTTDWPVRLEHVSHDRFYSDPLGSSPLHLEKVVSHIAVADTVNLSFTWEKAAGANNVTVSAHAGGELTWPEYLRLREAADDFATLVAGGELT
jgi:hypothetical protein